VHGSQTILVLFAHLAFERLMEAQFLLALGAVMEVLFKLQLFTVVEFAVHVGVEKALNFQTGKGFLFHPGVLNQQSLA
jgi:hypothetical protein